MNSRYQFCPQCSNMLSTKYMKEEERTRRKCLTCPYVYLVQRRNGYMTHEYTFMTPQSEIVDTEKADEHRQRTEIICPNCSHNEAFFYQMQTRSADEPMTNFYECTEKTCRHTWRD